MASYHGDSVVREYMREHPDETARVERLYSELRELTLGGLEGLCYELMTDVAKRRLQYRDALITDVVKCGVDKVLQMLEGQNSLLSIKQKGVA